MAMKMLAANLKAPPPLIFEVSSGVINLRFFICNTPFHVLVKCCLDEYLILDIHPDTFQISLIVN